MRLDALETELRRLRDVLFVGFRPLEETVVVQTLAVPGTDLEELRRDVLQLCEAHLGVPFVIDLGDAERPSRVRLLHVEVDPQDDVIVHLGYGGLCQSGRSNGGDPPAAAQATFEALSNLGAPVPFHVEAAATFEHPVGEGVMVVLGSDGQGPRFGVASGASPVQAAARATLHALNRYLSTQSLVVAQGA